MRLGKIAYNLGAGWNIPAPLKSNNQKKMKTELSINELRQLPLTNVIHWVAVSDAQPNKRDTYFVYDDFGFMGLRTWKDTFWEGDNIVGEPKVTHWTIVKPPCI